MKVRKTVAKNYDIAIIGGGIMGLAHAIHAVRAGLKTAVFERDAKGQGASMRNFGMLAIVAQAPGPQLDSARLSLGIWQEIAAQTGLSLLQAGCLFLARRQEEMAVLQESVSAQGQDDLALKLLTKSEVSDICPHVVSPKIQGGVWSPDAWKVDQRDALEKISQWLIQMGVDFHFSTPVIQASSGELETGRDRRCSSRRAARIDHLRGGLPNNRRQTYLRVVRILRCVLFKLQRRYHLAT